MVVSRRARVHGRPNRLSETAEARRTAGGELVDLTVSNPTVVGLPYDREGIARALGSEASFVYEPAPFGLRKARESVTALWRGRGLSVDPTHVALTASTSEAYALLFKLLCDPGDAVLVPRPSYPLFEHLARYEGIDARPYAIDYDGAWHVDPDRVRAAITPRTRALVVVSPNNPTGSFVKKSELAALSDLGLPIVSDEVFGAYGFGEDAARATSALEAGDSLVFALDGLSKLALLPQMKLAWITVGGPRALVEPALSNLEHVCDAFLSPSAPVQHGLAGLLRAADPTRDALRERLARNRAHLFERCAGTSVTPLSLEGGWYAVLRLPAVRSEEDWVMGLLEEASVLVQPGWFYDFETEPFLILCLLSPERDFEEGLSRIVAHVARNS
jgi:aspartate/methionine/tyrosine aminotransferase